MSEYKVNLMKDEEPSIAEKEQKVLENSGVEVNDTSGNYKIDLRNKPEQDAVQKQSTDEVPVREKPEAGQEMGEEVRSSEEPTQEEEQVIELIKEDNDAELQKQGQETDEQKIIEEKLVQEKEVVEQTTIELPENIQKVIDFMEETGGTLEDYVRLNTDYSNVDEATLLKEYYRQTKSHLDNDEINFLIEDNFSFDEDIDDERDIRRKKLAYKEELSKAKSFLNDLKGKYYDEVKLSSKLNPEQKEAVDFYNKYRKEQEELSALSRKQAEYFEQETSKVFNQDFKGFEFKVGDNRYRFKVGDAQQVKQQQSDVADFLTSFLNEQGLVKDAAEYHKALYSAKNADKIANHFYEQGKADAIRELEAKSKNINMDPRKSSEGYVEAGGIRVKAVTGYDSSKLRVKIKNKS